MPFSQANSTGKCYNYLYTYKINTQGLIVVGDIHVRVEGCCTPRRVPYHWG